MSNKSQIVKNIVADLPESDISEQELKDLLKKNNMDFAKILGDLAQKIDRDQFPDQKKKADDTADEMKDNKKDQTQIFGKRKVDHRATAKYHRLVELPRGGNSKFVNRRLAQLAKIDKINEQFAQEEISHPLQQDEIFQLVRDPEDNILESIQNSIGNANEYKKKLNVVKAGKRGMQPSLELRGIPI
jgi:hypothetical protein